MTQLPVASCHWRQCQSWISRLLVCRKKTNQTKSTVVFIRYYRHFVTASFSSFFLFPGVNPTPTYITCDYLQLRFAQSLSARRTWFISFHSLFLSLALSLSNDATGISPISSCDELVRVNALLNWESLVNISSFNYIHETQAISIPHWFIHTQIKQNAWVRSILLLLFTFCHSVWLF